MTSLLRRTTLAVLLVVLSALALPTVASADVEPSRQKYRITDLSDCGTLKTGARGPCVRSLQTWLNLADNADLSIDGRFGPATRAAVIHFQRRFGLPTAGQFGPASRAALRQWFQRTARSGSVALRCQEPETTDVCNRRLTRPVVYTDMGSRLLKAVACNGAALVLGRGSWLAQLAIGFVCELILDDAFD